MQRYTKLFPIFDDGEFSNQINPKIIIPKFAENDIKVVINFLKQYNIKTKKFIMYRQEIERLLLWTWLIAKKSVLHVKSKNILNYINFRLHPPVSWTNAAYINAFRFIEENDIRVLNPFWRPYNAASKSLNNYKVFKGEITRVFKILNIFFKFIMPEMKEVNESALYTLAQKQYVQQLQSPIRLKKLTKIQWKYCLKTAKQLADNNPSRHEKTLFLLSIFYTLHLPCVELTARAGWIPQMSHFYQDDNQKWWFKTLKKNYTIRETPVSDEMLKALKRYRRSRGLTSLPSSADSAPLLLKEKGKGAIKSYPSIESIIKLCFNETIKQLWKDNLIDEANTMRQATIASLCSASISDDTYISDDIYRHRGYSIQKIYENIGRESNFIIQKDQDIQLQERHKSARNKKLIEPF